MSSEQVRNGDVNFPCERVTEPMSGVGSAAVCDVKSMQGLSSNSTFMAAILTIEKGHGM